MAVAKDPNARFQTAAAFRNALAGVAAAIQAPLSPMAAAAAAPVAAPAVSAAPPPQAVAAPSKSKRWLWMSAGGVAAAAAIVCAIEFAPWKPTHAAVPAAPPSTAQAQPSPAPPDTATVPSPVPQDSAPAAVPTPTPPTATPQQSASAKPSARSSPNVPTPAPRQQPVEQAVAQPAPQPPASQPQPQPQQVATPPAAPAGPSRAEILQAREHFAKLQVRAGSIRDSLGNLKRTMQSQGMALNAKFTQPEGLMETYLRSAEQALNQSDLAAAKEYGDKAERQIEVLEKLLNL
jgi:hypothetical protein